MTSAAATIKITVVWNVTPFSLLDSFPQNVIKHLPDCRASRVRRQTS